MGIDELGSLSYFIANFDDTSGLIGSKKSENRINIPQILHYREKNSVSVAFHRLIITTYTQIFKPYGIACQFGFTLPYYKAKQRTWKK